MEIGLVVSDILQVQGQKVIESIGHPIDAFNEAKPYRDAADEWKHWGTVTAVEHEWSLIGANLGDI